MCMYVKGITEGFSGPFFLLFSFRMSGSASKVPWDAKLWLHKFKVLYYYNVIHSVNSFHLVTVNQRIKIEFILNVIIRNLDPNFKSVKSPLGNYDFIDSRLSICNVIHSTHFLTHFIWLSCTKLNWNGTSSSAIKSVESPLGIYDFIDSSLSNVSHSLHFIWLMSIYVPKLNVYSTSASAILNQKFSPFVLEIPLCWKVLRIQYCTKEF